MTCEATTKAGKPCAAPPREGGRFCIHHDPGAAAVRASARRQGGLARTKALDRTAPVAAPVQAAWWGLASVSDVKCGLAHIAREVLQGGLDARSANAAVAALNGLLGAIRDVELEGRIHQLEEAVERGNE